MVQKWRAHFEDLLALTKSISECWRVSVFVQFRNELKEMELGIGNWEFGLQAQKQVCPKSKLRIRLRKAVNFCVVP
jgi:hypothetical protein